MKHTVCRDEELKPGDMKAITVGRKPIVVVRSEEGETYALKNVCPHKGPPLSDGTLDRTCVASEPGQYSMEEDGEVLRCPWHSWEFDIKTGCSLFDPEGVRVRTYAVTIEEGNVFIHV